MTQGIELLRAINNDGNNSTSSHVRIYSWSGTSWGQLGADIDGEAGGDQLDMRFH